MIAIPYFPAIPKYIQQRFGPYEYAAMLLRAEAFIEEYKHPDYYSEPPSYLYEFLDNRDSRTPRRYWLESLHNAGYTTAEQLLDLAIARKRITPMMHSDIMAELQQIRMSKL
jgi:hypothetical protein